MDTHGNHSGGHPLRQNLIYAIPLNGFFLFYQPDSLPLSHAADSAVAVWQSALYHDGNSHLNVEIP